MIVAGTRLTDTEVASLAVKLRDAELNDCAERMESAYKAGDRLFHLSTEERSAFRDALDDCPEGLLPLRASLQEQLLTVDGEA